MTVVYRSEGPPISLSIWLMDELLSTTVATGKNRNQTLKRCKSCWSNKRKWSTLLVVEPHESSCVHFRGSGTTALRLRRGRSFVEAPWNGLGISNPEPERTVGTQY